MASKPDTKGVVRLGKPGNERPTHKELNRILTDYCEHWNAIGLHLDLKRSVLRTIGKDHPMDERECFRVTLDRWLEMDPEATWSTLELAITNVNREKLGLDALDTSSIRDEGLHLSGDGQLTVQVPVESAKEPAKSANKYSDSAKPEMGDLNRIVVPKIQADWEEVAYALRYEISTVKSIKEENGSPKKCCSGLLTDWLTTDNGNSPKTWGTLIKALKGINELHSVTQEIEKELGK